MSELSEYSVKFLQTIQWYLRTQPEREKKTAEAFASLEETLRRRLEELLP